MIDRMPMIEGWFRAPLDLGVRVGGMRNRVTVTDDGSIPDPPEVRSPRR